MIEDWNPRLEGHEKPDSRGQKAGCLAFRVPKVKPWALDYGSRALVCLWLVGFVLNTFAAALPSAADEEKIPPLRPPRGPIPAGVWEQYGVWIIAGCCVVLLLVAAAIWFLLRPKPAIIIPPEAEARRTLDALRHESETGAVLSRVSQVVRRYFGAVFGFPAGELTTTEFCRSLNAAPEPGPDLARRVSAFLQECDERKFAPSAPLPPMGAVTRASQLVADAETRRAQLRAMAATSPAGRPAHSSESNSVSTGTRTT